MNDMLKKMKLTLKNLKLHIKKIMTHRKWVRYYCFKCGLYIQGLLHDLSKYSPTELIESVRYYQGDRSPILACKEDKGYSMAWFHHRGRNKHHWEYWVDNFDKGMTTVIIPEKYALEMFCDFLGAGQAYMGDMYTSYKELEWWKSKRDKYVLHPAIKEFLDTSFNDYVKYGITYLTEYKACRLKYNYKEAIEKYS